MLFAAFVAAEAASGRKSMVFVGQCALPGAVQEVANNDGADGTVAGQAPHQKVFRDGYWSVGCRLDAMQLEGDKYGDERQSYDVGRSVNTSIVRYDEILDRENQKPMTPRVCFDFCRTVPEMSFFGLLHGRDCYCMHYYKDAAGGSGVCDLPCEGDSGKMCGGEHKSSIYQMHSCEGGLEQDLADLEADATVVEEALHKAMEVTQDVAQAMQQSGDALEALGEATASPLAQEAKAVAGPLTRAAEALVKLDAEGAAVEPPTADPGSFEGRKQIEETIATVEGLMDQADEAIPAANEWVSKTQPTITLPEDFTNTFVPILRQVDPDMERRMSVCEGDLTGTPIVGLSYDECTQACDDLAPKSSPDHCIAVQYVGLPDAEPLCFLFSELTELTVFNCDYEGDGATAAPEPEKGAEEPTKLFLQRVRAAKPTHAHHVKKHQKVVRKHGKKWKKQHKKRVLLAHPAAQFVLEDTFRFRSQKKAAVPGTFCSIRYASTVGVTPTFFDGRTDLDRCFGA